MTPITKPCSCLKLESLELHFSPDRPGCPRRPRRGGSGGRAPREAAEHDAVPEVRLLLLLRRPLPRHCSRHRVSEFTHVSSQPNIAAKFSIE